MKPGSVNQSLNSKEHSVQKNLIWIAVFQTAPSSMDDHKGFLFSLGGGGLQKETSALGPALSLGCSKDGTSRASSF